MLGSGPTPARRSRSRRLVLVVTAAVAAASLVAASPAEAAKHKTKKTKPSAPAAPTDVVAVPSDRAATVTWVNPSGDVKRYRVTDTASGRSKVVPAKSGSATSSVVVGGLANGVPTSFVVAAEAASRKGTASKPSATVVPLPVLKVSGTLMESASPYQKVLTVSLSQRQDTPLTFRLQTTDTGQATPGTDFVALDTLVTIPAGKTQVKVPLTLLDDNVAETTETIGVVVTSAAARQVAASVPPTILDDDASTYLYLDGAPPTTEGNSGTTILHFALRMSRPLAAPVTVRLEARTTVLVDGAPHATAVRAQLAQPVQVVTIPALSVYQPVDVAVLGDTVPEPTMRVRVTTKVISGPVAVAEGVNDAAVADDDTDRPTGADLAVTLPSLDLWGANGDGRVAVDVTNASNVAAKAVTVTVGATAAGTAEALAKAVTADPACTLTSQSSWVGAEDAGRRADLEWTCPIGVLAAHGESVLHFPVARKAATQPEIDWSVGVTSSPFSDPWLTDNTAEGVVSIPQAG